MRDLATLWRAQDYFVADGGTIKDNASSGAQTTAGQWAQTMAGLINIMSPGLQAPVMELTSWEVAQKNAGILKTLW